MLPNALKLVPLLVVASGLDSATAAMWFPNLEQLPPLPMQPLMTTHPSEQKLGPWLLSAPCHPLHGASSFFFAPANVKEQPVLRVIKLKTENNSHTKSHEAHESLLSLHFVRGREGTIHPSPSEVHQGQSQSSTNSAQKS